MAFSFTSISHKISFRKRIIQIYKTLHSLSGYNIWDRTDTSWCWRFSRRNSTPSRFRHLRSWEINGRHGFQPLGEATLHRTTDNDSVHVEDWYIPMRLASSRHSYVQIKFEHQIRFKRSQLVKLHRNFYNCPRKRSSILLPDLDGETLLQKLKNLLKPLQNEVTTASE